QPSPRGATFLRPSIAYLLPARVTRSPPTRNPTRRWRTVCRRLGRLASQDSVMGGSSPVPEYQPDVHRLRLSASPYVPTYPGQINLTLEPLVIRRTGFSPVFRYSCLHSHSCGVHGWITPPLHSPHDAPLPIDTLGSRPRGS